MAVVFFGLFFFSFVIFWIPGCLLSLSGAVGFLSFASCAFYLYSACFVLSVSLGAFGCLLSCRPFFCFFVEFV